MQGAARTPFTQVPTLHIWSDADWALGEYGARATERFVSGPYRFEVLHPTIDMCTAYTLA